MYQDYIKRHEKVSVGSSGVMKMVAMPYLVVCVLYMQEMAGWKREQEDLSTSERQREQLKMKVKREESLILTYKNLLADTKRQLRDTETALDNKGEHSTIEYCNNVHSNY